MYISIFLCLFLFIISLICSKYNIFSPSVITSGIWLAVLLLYTFLGSHLNPLTDKFLSAIDIWVTLFCVSSLFIQALSLSRNNRIEPSQLARNIFFYASLVTFPLLILHAYEIVKLGTSTNWMADLRSAAVGEIKGINIEDSNPFYVVIWLISYFIELFYFSKENRMRVAVLFFMYFLFGFITMAKLHFLILILGSLYMLYYKKSIKLKHILVGMVLLSVIFYGIQLLRAKDKANNPGNSMIELYLLSPSPAFETVRPASSTKFGENVFRIVYAIEYKLGFTDKEPVDTLLNFVYVGVGTNTYTVLYPFYKDFGVAGIGFFAIFLGLILGYIYNKAEDGDVLFIIIYAFLLTEIIMQYGAEIFFTNLSLNLKRIIIALLPFLISRYELFSEVRRLMEAANNNDDE